MPILELVVTLCLIQEPDVCRDSKMQIFENVTPMQCMSKSIEVIVKEMENKPQYFPKRWTCRPPLPYAKV